MKCNKLKILLVFLVLIMSVGMVSASESVSMDADVNDVNEQLAINQVITDENILSDGEVGTFTELDELITQTINSKKDVLDLTKDYKYDSIKDSSILRNGISISRFTINGNNHTIDGSGIARIFTQYSGQVTLNDIHFVNGRSPYDSNGGAIIINSGNLTVNHCTFENNAAQKHGGAIAVSLISGSSYVKAYDSTFDGNTAKYNGGSIYARNLIVDNSSFSGNRILTRYSKNHMQLEEKGLGGAIFAQNSLINHSTFKGNTVFGNGEYQIDEGGGAIVSTGQLIVDNSYFEKNKGFKGGAIFGISAYDSELVPRNYVKVYNSIFYDNSAYNAGAICSNFNLTTDHCLFDSNNATGYGGGAINTGFKSNNNIFTYSNFTNNEALNYGGALSTSHSHIDNCIFEGNKARHGGAIFSLSFDISKSTLKDNVATEGKNIIVIDGYTKDDYTKISESDVIQYNQNKVSDYLNDVLDGASRDTHYIPTGDFAGYSVFCVEEHLFRPENTEGVLIDDLSYIVNSLDRTGVEDYLRVMFYLLDARPEKYVDYTDRDIQTVTWVFTDGDYLHSRDRLVRDVLDQYYNHWDEMNMTNNSYTLPNGELMEYDMVLFLTPSDRQNMVLFKSQPFVPRHNETVSKTTLNTTVLVGENVKFKISVTNNGNMILNDVFVKDIKYSKGLVYKNWYSDVGNWTYDGHGKWTLDHTLRLKQTVSFIVEFETTEVGVLVNNVTSGYGNFTVSNSTNTTTTYPNPEMSVRKISNNKKVQVGKTVSFTVVVENTGKYDITGLYIIDNDYSEGLVYDYFVDPTNLWQYVGNGKWIFNGVLKVGEKRSIILYFIAKTTGLKTNNVTAGNNQTNKTVNSTNKTNVTKENKKPTNNTTKKDNKTKHHHENKTKVHHYNKIRYDKNATGNPLFALILVLISLNFITFRRRK
ncbi:hypothetical protein [uncultured Methanobrevibacter sp.]|uniref:hypothetical protein n=1 Tax=uncultured Methanobrevibacter sp. TaxID=253161 RepID=UPI0025E94D9B|nr:hypothetical protein [uncultured Methanobrevibacter sp.]